ncbi:Uncharacterized protein C12orf35-like [Cricetulus griseus]|uniref:Uncharacterized protein C12orf35-like n=1 Tax=Cricetulus griseus TaxID=10029 RepID=G3IDF6_CRIGR|nr:Uncharacterized protein C12orf35-like [Cricetulus griseus]
MSAKRDNQCSMELLATCLSLWKNQPPKTTEENVSKPLEEKQYNASRTSTTAVGPSNPMNEVHVKNFCSGVRNSQKITTSSQTVLSVLTPVYDSSDVAVGKGTELQIAVVSPLILSDVSTVPGKELAPEVVSETVYPVVKEGSVCSLQNQQAENATVTAGLPFDVIRAVASATVSAELSLPGHKEKQHKPTQTDLDTADGSLGKHSPQGAEALPNPRDSTIVSGPILQIESICSLAEGDVSYNSQIAEIFNSVQNEPQKPSPDQQVINSQQEEQVDKVAENKDLSFLKDKCMQCTDVPHEVTEQPEPLQPLETTSDEYVEANGEILEESSKENPGEKEMTKDILCSPAAVQQDPQPQEIDTASSKSGHSFSTVNEINDENEPVSYLHDQLLELLKEFPYGIETIARPEVYVGQQKTHEILENQTGSKTDVEIKKKKYEKQEQNKNAGGTLKLCSTLTEPNERACAKEKIVTNSEPSDSKGSSSKSTRVITVQEYLQRKKDKHVIGNNASKNICVENVPCDSEPMKSSKHSASPSLGKLIEGQGVSAETLKEVEHNSSSHGKNLKTHRSEETRPYSVSNSKEKFYRTHPDKSYIDKAKLERLTSMSSKSSQLQVKEKRKQYLNRVAFKCTEQESICLTKLDSASKKLSKEKEKSTACAPMTKDYTHKPMLEFKLCPDVLLKNTSSIDKGDDPRPGPEKERAPVQVSGIKTTKEDWLKCIPTRTKMPESSEQTDRADSRLSKRSFSADEFETLQNPVKDSNVMFRTFKKMYLEKRSRSLGSSPVK